MTSLTRNQIEQYSRQIILEEIGAKGMEKLISSRVAIIGAGGLGCPITQMLTAVGIGFIRIIDNDIVELSNLPRQFLHYPSDIDSPKVESISKKLRLLNPNVEIEPIQDYVSKENILKFIKDVDFVVDATDNFATKYLINDACCFHQKPFIIAGSVQFYGQLISVIPGETTCYRCVFENEGIDDPSQNCSGLGVLGTAPTIGGTIQANEVIRYLLGLKPSFINQLFIYNLLEGTFDKIPLGKRKNCKTCGDLTKPFYKEHKYKSNLQNCSL